MNKYFLGEGIAWIFLGLILSFIWAFISIPFYFLSAEAYSYFSMFGLVAEYGAISIGALIFIGGLFVNGKNDYFETKGIIGSVIIRKRKEEVELAEANKKWKKMQKENKP